MNNNGCDLRFVKTHNQTLNHYCSHGALHPRGQRFGRLTSKARKTSCLKNETYFFPF